MATPQKKAAAVDRAAHARAVRLKQIAERKALVEAAAAEAAATPEPSKKPKMKPLPSWSGDERFARFGRDVDWQDADSEIPCVLPRDVIEAINGNGFDLQWIAESCLGKDLNRDVARFEANGWTRLENDDLRDDGPFASLTGHAVDYDGLHLYARPMGLTLKARKIDKAKASDAVRIKQEALVGGDNPGITMVGGARHPSAVRSNRINKTVEPLDVPGMDD